VSTTKKDATGGPPGGGSSQAVQREATNDWRDNEEESHTVGNQKMWRREVVRAKRGGIVLKPARSKYAGRRVLEKPWNSPTNRREGGWKRWLGLEENMLRGEGKSIHPGEKRKRNNYMGSIKR